jgi:ABC-type nitrate/sulfonate/bicarbonate transport system permease component
VIVGASLPSWRRRPTWVDGLLGGVAVLVLWQLLAVTVLAASRVVPPPTDVVSQLWLDRASYPANVMATLRVALVGYAVGNLMAIALGVLCELVPVVEGPVLRLAIACFNIPLVAIAPILIVVLPDDGPKIALAALSVFFTTLIATGLGLRAADATSLDVVRAAGGDVWTSLRKVKAWAALPSILGGLRVAAPAALLGAIIGEYLGTQQGLGAAMIQAQSSFAVARTWGIALVVAALAGMLYLAATALALVLTPWAGHVEIGLGRAPDRPAPKGPSRLARSAAFLAASVGLLIVVWYGLIRVFDLNPFFAKDPDDVFRYLAIGPDAAEHRQFLVDALGRTVRDAAGGYLVGTLAATAAAIAVVLSRGIEQAVMPVAVTLRSVPLVAMTPLIALIFGRGYLGVTAVVSIVVFFPTLVNVAVGLRAAPALACDLVRASGGTPLMVMRKVRLPYALPAFFASARIAAPAAIGGATLAEWLATGAGLGNVLVVSYSASDFNTLWSGAALIVAVSVALYGLVGAIEGWTARRMMGDEAVG